MSPTKEINTTTHSHGNKHLTIMKKISILLSFLLISTSAFSQLRWTISAPTADSIIPTKWTNKTIYIYGNDEGDQSGFLNVTKNESSVDLSKLQCFYFKKSTWVQSGDNIPNLLAPPYKNLPTGWYKIKELYNSGKDSLVQHAYIYNSKKPIINYILEDASYRENCDTLKVTCSASLSDDSIAVIDFGGVPDTLLIENKINYKWSYIGSDEKLKNSENRPILFLANENLLLNDTMLVVEINDLFSGIVRDTSDIIETIRLNASFEFLDSTSLVYGNEYINGDAATFTIKNTSYPRRNWNRFEWIVKSSDGAGYSIKRSASETIDDNAIEDFKLTVKRSGKNSIYLVATSNKGVGANGYCVDTLTTVKVSVDELKLEIPNAFTPDKDKDKYFQVFGKNTTTAAPEQTGVTGIISFKGVIFNRWGKIVYNWSNFRDIDAGWDGTINGSPAPAGTYFYKIDATGTNATIKKSGPLLLIRDK